MPGNGELAGAGLAVVEQPPLPDEEVTVRCYSGRTYAERPRSFCWRGQEVAVEEVLAEWREPAGPAFRLRTPRGIFVLAYDEAADRWWLRALLEPQ